MKRRSLRLLILVVVATLVIANGLASGLFLLIPQPKAYADGEQYVLNFIGSDKGSIDKCIKNKNCTVDDLNNVFIYAQGGVFGSTPVQLKYEPYETIPNPLPPQANFTGNYSCQNYSVSVVVNISNLGNLEQGSYKSMVLLDNVRNTSTGEDTTAATQDSNGDGTGDLSQGDSYLVDGQIQQSGLPSACEPGNLTTGIGQPSKTHQFSIPNFNGLSKAAQATWGPSVANPTPIAKTAPAPATATPSLGCQGGPSISLSGIFDLVTNPLNWLFCGIVAGLVGIVQSFDAQINAQLAIGTHGGSDKPTAIFGDSSTCTAGNACDNYHTAWASFRDLALGLMVIAGLVMVIAHALGLELLDAYTIRKVLPRLLVAAIGIALSWQLMEFAVTLSNDLGYGVTSLITGPFSGASNASLHLNFGQALSVGILGAIGLVIAGLFGLMTLAGMAALAMIVAYTVIVLRQAVVILLAILAPIALIAYVLPNTQRVYRLWWDTFLKTLLMFPMITALIATGYVFAWATLQTGSSDLQYQMIAFVAYFAPYFMIPMTFRFAGGVMSGLGNFVQSRTRPAQSFLSKKLGEKARANFNNARDDSRFHRDFGDWTDKNTRRGRLYHNLNARYKKRFGEERNLAPSVGHLGNRMAAWMTDADQLIPYRLGREGAVFGAFSKGVPGFKRYSPALGGRIADRVIEDSTKRAQTIAGIHYAGQRALVGDYEDLSEGTQAKLEAAGFGTRDEEGNWTSKTYHNGSLGHTKLMSEILQQSDKENERLSGEEMWAHRGAIATIRDPEEFRFADLQTAALFNLAQAGRAEHLADNANTISARMGPEAAARIYKTAADIDSRIRTEQRHGYGVTVEAMPDGSTQYVDVWSDRIDPHTKQEYYKGGAARKAISSAGYHGWAGAKGESVAKASKTFLHVLSNPEVTGDDGKLYWSGEQQGFLNQIHTGATSYGGDPGMQKEWRKIADQLREQYGEAGLTIPPQLQNLDQQAAGEAELSEAGEDAARAAREAAEARDAER